jgi:hypothetical protein
MYFPHESQLCADALAIWQAGVEAVRSGRLMLSFAAVEHDLGTLVRSITEGVFLPTPSAFACSGCPALDRVCAGPRL